jgi:hypothetical protein
MRLHARCFTPREDEAVPIVKPMRDLIGDDFRRALSADQASRFRAAHADLMRLLGRSRFERLASPGEQADLAPVDWAKITARFLKRYVITRDRAKKGTLVKAYVPILQLGILDFLNRTYLLRYDQAARILDEEYLPAFERAWSILAHRIWLWNFSLLRKWPVRVRTRVIGIFSRHTQPGASTR